MILSCGGLIPDGLRDDPAVHTPCEGTFWFNRAREPELVMMDTIVGVESTVDHEDHVASPSTNGPLISWMYPVFGVRGASWFLGISEWITAALLIWGFWNKKAGAVGAFISTATFITTITIVPFTPDGWDAAAGFHAMKGNVAFLMKDIVLLAVPFYLLKQDVVRASLGAAGRHQGKEVDDARAYAAAEVTTK